MARLARAVFAGVPHHVTQRGNGRAQTFFSDDDDLAYRELMAEHAAAAGVQVWSWVLMPNHVHLILVPGEEDALRRMLASAHRRYAGRIHARMQRTGHFWQGRFGCVARASDARSGTRGSWASWSDRPAAPSPPPSAGPNPRQRMGDKCTVTVMPRINEN